MLASSVPARADDKPQIRAFRAIADTYASVAAPQRNFGHVRVLRVDSAPRTTAYVKFRLKNVKGKITGVTLLLHTRAGARKSFQVRRVYDDNWREETLTYGNAPRLSLRYTSSRPVMRGEWSAVDVTAFVDDGGGSVSLAITTRSPLGVVFASRESRHGPRLVFTSEEDAKGAHGP